VANGIDEADYGLIGRRDLLQAFGLIAGELFVVGPAMKAAAAFAATVAQGSSRGAGKTFPVTTVNHLALSSNDYARSRDFYVDLFGMRIVWDDGKGCALEFGSLTSPNGIYIRPVARGVKPTINHMAFGIPNFLAQKSAMRTEMERRGLKGIRPDSEMGWSCDDPAGFPIDIWVPEKDKAMFPGAAGPCKIAASTSCLAGWQAGQKNLGASAKPSGRGFKASSYSFIVLNVADVYKERDFYRDLLGMKVIYETSEPSKRECFLTFGGNTLQLRQTASASVKPSCNEFGLAIENFNRDAVEAELIRRGLKPQPDSKLSWTIADPDGYQIDVSAAGFSEHIAKDCNGSKATCPGGPTG